MGVVRIGDRPGRRARVDHLTTAVNTSTALHSATVNTSTAVQAAATNSTMSRRTALRAEVAAVIESALLPTDRSRDTAGTAATARRQLPEQAARRIATAGMIAAAASIVTQATRRADNQYRD